MLSIAEAARLLGCSRPRVAMLVQHGLVTGATLTGTEKCIPRSSLLAYKASQPPIGSSDYKAAARDAGMYRIPDKQILRALAKRRSRN